MAAVNPENPLSYAGSQTHRRHNIEVLHRAGKSPQEITQQTGYKKIRWSHFWRVWFRCGETQLICVVLLNALQVYSTVQNGEGIARKAGSGRFPH